ncbi:MAG TPA: T9SS type A sorting domain-containing protein, partial [Ignavibacteriaceae bacterium]|nr:T9SS type A sorting domain-containing protein [Ignavibacteriaceae bacterium]
PDTNPASIQVSIPITDYPVPIKTGLYQMISIPLSINAPQIDSVFGDDYGPYDQRVWRIFHWQPGINDYEEYNSIGNLTPGSAYWLINREGKTFDATNALSVSSFNNYTITLQPGYNQIGNPFAFSVNWFSIENSDSIQQLPILWNPDTQDYELDLIIYEPWVGYWVYNPLNHIINLGVNPNVSLFKEKSINYFASLKEDEFLVQLKTSLSSSNSRDQQNYIGMMEDAKNDLDKYDVIKPPSINNDLRVLIESGKNYYARNVVPVSKDGAYWDFTVETKEGNQKVSLNIEPKSSLPDNFSIWLLDKSGRVPVGLNNGTGQIITRDNGKGSFRIIIGTEEFAKLNSDDISLNVYEYALYQNYPNPFNPSTNITYQLKEKSYVTLEVFNILGERVTSIINDVVQDPGQHIVSWNGLNSSGEKTASGIYIYRIKANNFISSKKMILLK